MYYLRKVYREAGVKKKKIRRTKIIEPAHQVKIDAEALVAKDLLQKHIKEGYRVIYIDEFMTTKATMPTHDWTPRNQAFRIDYKLYHKKTVAAIGAISKEDGTELIMTFDKSVNSAKFIKFL